MNVQFRRTTPADVDVLTVVQKITFDDDSQKYLGKPCGGPPGYDSAEWSLARMHDGIYFKMVADSQIIGGIIVFNLGSGHFNLGRIYIHPDYQNRGIGTQALQFLETTFQEAKRWSLDTPVWATRNHHFYEKMGYVRVGASGDEDILYEKQLVR